VAAFPLPTLDLHVTPSLRGLFRSCETECVVACCGMDAFDISVEHVSGWRGTHPVPHVVTTLGDFEVMLGQVARHRGSISANERVGYFSHTWQTPHDCLTYFADWRQAISEAIRGMDDPPFFNPAWMTETVVALRNAILAEKAFDRLPVLADALEEAGCDNRFILDHLRGDEDHTHMCWVLDLLSVGTR
jgi:hypothetical protein